MKKSTSITSIKGNKNAYSGEYTFQLPRNNTTQDKKKISIIRHEDTMSQITELLNCHPT
jgi:hypothetical protein